MKVTSPVFDEGGHIPDQYSYDGRNVSPPLVWSGVPEKAASLAIVVEDPDAPSGTFGHWVVYNIPPDWTGLDEGAGVHATRMNGAEQGVNGFGETGYGGPRPPSGTHRYVFRLFALDTRLGLEGQATRDELLAAVDGHTLAEARLVGTYTKK